MIPGEPENTGAKYCRSNVTRVAAPGSRGTRCRRRRSKETRALGSDREIYEPVFILWIPGCSRVLKACADDHLVD